MLHAAQCAHNALPSVPHLTVIAHHRVASLLERAIRQWCTALPGGRLEQDTQWQWQRGVGTMSQFMPRLSRWAQHRSPVPKVSSSTCQGEMPTATLHRRIRQPGLCSCCANTWYLPSHELCSPMFFTTPLPQCSQCPLPGKAGPLSSRLGRPPMGARCRPPRTRYNPRA